MNWFEVDKEGLAKLLERRGKGFAVLELIQNCWDEDVTQVIVTLTPIPDKPLAELIVEDDAPNGFVDLTHAYTLFAESTKKNQPEKRGRFNLGEKLVLAICDKATISSTKGTIEFRKDGRRSRRNRRARGSEFCGIIRMTRSEYDQACSDVRLLLPPTGIKTTFNGSVLEARSPLHSFEATLPTELADAEGIMRRSARKTTISLHETRSGETAYLYEMGIPVVETGDKWHVDVRQKVPLNTDRDNVTPAFLRTIRLLVFNAMYLYATNEDVNQPWVREATSDERCSPAAIERVMTLRFGKKRVSYDPSDPEANNLAVCKGFTVVHGGMMSKMEWKNARKADAIKPAGQITPSPKPYSNASDALPETLLPESEWTPNMRHIVEYTKTLAMMLMNVNLQVRISTSADVLAGATYGCSPSGGDLMLNIHHLGQAWFECGVTESVDKLLIHEFGHHYSCNHLSEEYHEALCMLGAKLKQLSLERPEFFASYRQPQRTE